MTELSDLAQRVSKIETVISVQDRNHTDLSNQHTALTRQLDIVIQRLNVLEQDKQEQRVLDAADRVKNEQLQENVAKITKFMEDMKDNNVVNKVNGISAGFNRLFWLVITAIVTGAIGLLFLVLRGAT